MEAAFSICVIEKDVKVNIMQQFELYVLSNFKALVAETIGVPGGGRSGRQPPQFEGQTKPVGQYSLHSRAILAYYKNKCDKFCQFCGKFCQFCGKYAI